MTSVVSESHVVFLMLLATVALAGCTFLPHLPPPTPSLPCLLFGNVPFWVPWETGGRDEVAVEQHPHRPSAWN